MASGTGCGEAALWGSELGWGAVGRVLLPEAAPLLWGQRWSLISKSPPSSLSPPPQAASPRFWGPGGNFFGVLVEKWVVVSKEPQAFPTLTTIIHKENWEPAGSFQERGTQSQCYRMIRHQKQDTFQSDGEHC